MPIRKSQSEGDQMATMAEFPMLYVKLLGLFLTVWYMGHIGISFSWLLIGLFIYLFNGRYKRKKQLQIEIAQEFAKDEKKAILARVDPDELPSWVIFPDVERAEWVNKILEQMWPYIGELTKDILMKKVQPLIVANLPDLLKSFSFVKIDLGDNSPRIDGVKTYVNNDKRDEIVLDLELTYDSDADIKISVKGIDAGIKDLKICGNLRVILRPLIPKVPLVGAVTVFFLTNPRVEFHLTNVASAIMDIPFVSNKLISTIKDQIAAHLVLPNRIPIALVDNIAVFKLKHPMPQGVLRIHVIEAKDLKNADAAHFRGKSDPYIILKVGAATFRTKVIKNNLSPIWNEFFEVAVDQRSGQSLEFEVMDEDTGEDDSLGGSTVQIESIAEKGMLDAWIQLEEGQVHFGFTWLYLSSDSSALQQSIHQCQSALVASDSTPLSSCLLEVTIESASRLPNVDKGGKEPSPYAVINCNDKQVQTRVIENEFNPRWEEIFQFLINDPSPQILDVEVKDKKTGHKLGTYCLPLKQLLNEDQMIQDQSYNLGESTSDSLITMRVVLKILSTEKPSNLAEERDNLLITKPNPAENKVKPEPIEATYEVLDTPGENGKPETETHGNTEDPSENLPVSSSLGRMQITIRYNPGESKLIVVVHKCVHLILRDSNQEFDPYVSIHLLKEKTILGKHKTKVIKNTLDPIFDETFEFSIHRNDLKTRKLAMSVKNSTGRLSKSQMSIGRVLIDLNKFDLSKTITEWFDLQPADQGV